VKQFGKCEHCEKQLRRPLLAKGHQAVKDFLFHSLSIAVFILSFYILLSLLSHTFLLSHIAIDPQSESPTSQLTVHPLPPGLQKTVSDALGPHLPLAFPVRRTPRSVW
jgi:hypothetical protein